MSDSSNSLDPAKEYDFGADPRQLYPDPSYKPSIANYLPMVYVTIAIMIVAFVAMKLYKGAKKRAKPFKVEVKASVSVTKPEEE
jgi:hypothetical protein